MLRRTVGSSGAEDPATKTSLVASTYSIPNGSPGPSPIGPGPMRPDTMQAQWLLVPGRARRHAKMAAEARLYGLFFGSGRHGDEDGPTGRDRARHYPALHRLRRDVHGAAAVRISSQIRAMEVHRRYHVADSPALEVCGRRI
jgi:hypothetical protein